MLKKAALILLLGPLFAIGCNNNGDEPDLAETPLYIECVEGETMIKYFYSPYGVLKRIPNLEYSTDLEKWSSVDIEPTQDEEITIQKLKKGQRIYFRGDNPNGFNYYASGSYDYLSFRFVNNSEVKINIGGNVMSLLSIDQFNKKTDIPCEGCFYSLFEDFAINELEEDVDYGNVDACNLALPATDLKDYAYCFMFDSSSLLKAPTLLPAKAAKQGAYEGMFEYNTKLITAPVICLQKLEESVCSDTFYGCEMLDITKDTGKQQIFVCPELTGKYCVDCMFDGTKNELDDPIVGEVFYYN